MVKSSLYTSLENKPLNAKLELGDYFLIKDIIAESMGEQTMGLTSIDNSVESHVVGFAAERSRLAEGEMQRIKY